MPQVEKNFNSEQKNFLDVIFFFFFFFLGEQMNERFERPASVVVTTMFIVAWKQRSWSYMTLPTITTMI